MNTTETSTYARSLYEARLDAECYAVSHNLHARMWRRFRMALRIIAGFSGSAAFGGWLATKPEISGIAGLLVAMLTAIDQAIEPTDKIAAHIMAAQRYISLKSDSIANARMTIEEFDARLESIKADDAAGIDALLTRAFNRVVRSVGRSDYQVHESLWCRFVAFFA